MTISTASHVPFRDVSSLVRRAATQLLTIDKFEVLRRCLDLATAHFSARVAKGQ